MEQKLSKRHEKALAKIRADGGAMKTFIDGEPLYSAILGGHLPQISTHELIAWGKLEPNNDGLFGSGQTWRAP